MSIALENKVRELEAKVERMASLAAEMEQLRAELRTATEGIESRIDTRAKGVAMRFRARLTRCEELSREVLEWRRMLEQGVRERLGGETQQPSEDDAA